MVGKSTDSGATLLVFKSSFYHLFAVLPGAITQPL